MAKSLKTRIDIKTAEFLSNVDRIEIAKASKESISQQIEGVFGFAICNKSPATIDDILTCLDFKSPCLDLLTLIFSAEYIEKDCVFKGTQVHSPDESVINGFFTCLVNDVKLQMLEKSIVTLTEYFKSNELPSDKTLRRIKSELFYSRDEFMQKYMSIMDNSEIWGASFDKRKLQRYIEENDFHTVIPRTNFLWGCYKLTRITSEDKLQINQLFDAFKCTFRLKNLSKVKTLNNNAGEDILREQEQFIHFIKKLHEVNSKGQQSSIIIENMNKSLNLQAFNESTRLMDIYLAQHMVDADKYLQEFDDVFDRYQIDMRLIEDGKPVDYYTDNQDENRKELNEELKHLTAVAPIKYNNLKLFLLNFEYLSEELNILENISSQKLISIIDSMVSFLQRYLENVITSSSLHQNLNVNCSKPLANQILIYEYLKDFEPNTATIKDLYGSFEDYKVNRALYYLTYSNVQNHLTKSLDVYRD